MQKLYPPGVFPKVVALWIRPSAVRRQEQEKLPKSKDSVDTAIISKCHRQVHYSCSQNATRVISKVVLSDLGDLQNSSF